MHRFLFALPPLNVHVARGLGGVGFGGSLPSAAALSGCACQRIERASGLNLVFALAPFNFSGLRAVFSGDLYNRRWRFWWIHACGTRGQAPCTVFVLRFHR